MRDAAAIPAVAAYMLGLSAAIVIAGTPVSANAATVTCNTTLYYCSYGLTDIVIVTTTQGGSTSPLQGYGVYLNNSQANVYDLRISTSGSGADGIRTTSQATLLAADRLTIFASGASADGINLSSDSNADYDGLVYVTSYANIESVSGVAVRANNFQNAGSNSVIILPDGSVVSQTGSGTASNNNDTVGYGVFAGNSARDINGLGLAQIFSGVNNNTLGNSYVFLGSSATISTSMDGGHAVYANKGGLIQLGDNVNITTTGNNAFALYAAREQQGSHTTNIRSGHIYLGGGATLRASNSSIVMLANGIGSVIANKIMATPSISNTHQRSDRITGLDKSVTQSTSGVFDIIGKLDANDGGEISLNMTSGSQFLGSTDVHLANATASNITLNISGTNSFWQLDQNSSLSSLTLSDGARLTPYSSSNSLTSFTLQGDVTNNLGIVDIAGSASRVGDVLTIEGNYMSSGGYVHINTALGDDNSNTDRLIINGNISAGQTGTIKVFNVGGAGAQTVNGIKIIEVNGQSGGSFSLDGNYIHNGDQSVTAGAYAYKLYQGGVSSPNDGHWYLRSMLINAAVQYQAGIPVYESYPQLLLGMNSLPTMQQRASQRSGRVTQSNGIWGRIDGARTKARPHNGSTLSDYDYATYRMQAGVDGLLSDSDEGLFVGSIMAHHVRGALDSRSIYDASNGGGHINANGYGVGVSISWFENAGFYVDVQGQLTWYDSDLQYNGRSSLTNGNAGFGSALSLETGQRLKIDQYWSLTPQAQLSWSDVSFDSFTDVFGADVSLKQGEVLKGRFGLAVDYDQVWSTASGTINRANFYGTLNLEYEVLNGTRTQVENEQFRTAQDRLNGGIGIGASYNWNDDRYSLFGEASISTSLRSFGDTVPYKFNAGLRVKW